MAFPEAWNMFIFVTSFHTYMGISRLVIVTSQQLEMFEIIHKFMTGDMLLYSSTVAKSQSIFRSSSEQIAQLR
jgi:non-homologous end joining protein Ku